MVLSIRSPLNKKRYFQFFLFHVQERIFQLRLHKSTGIERNNNKNMNCRWNYINECTVCYYQNDFNASKIVAKLSDCDENLNKHIKAKRFTSDEFFLYLSNMRETAKAHEPEDRSVTTNVSEKNEEDAQVVLENNNEETK